MDHAKFFNNKAVMIPNVMVPNLGYARNLNRYARFKSYADNMSLNSSLKPLNGCINFYFYVWGIREHKKVL